MPRGLCDTRAMNRLVRKIFSFGLVASALALGPATAPAGAQQGSGFASYLQYLSARARGEGVSERTIAAMTAGLTYNPRVIQLDRSQPGGNPAVVSTTYSDFEPYRRAHVDAARINGGRRQYAALVGQRAALERRFGVPLPIMLAIWGHETNYGSYTGDFDLARSLATLAYDGRRRELFSDEFVALLKMVDRGVPRYRLKGSWAGAFGNPQFLPSVYLRVAADGDGDDFADIWSSRADTVASIGNYLRDAGWRPGEPWGIAVDVPPGFNRARLGTTLASPRCQAVFARHSGWKTMREWRALGLVPRKGYWPADNTFASLIEPDGPRRTAYLLTGNYRVILDYNCSNYYALSVGLLADAIAS
jgi:membrane-bound lytic murein transglycosylase B